MATFLTLALAASLASPACQLGPSNSIGGDVSSFTALQGRYRALAPAELMGRPVIAAAEKAAASTVSSQPDRAAYVALAVYRAQLSHLKATCSFSDVSATALIEESYAQVIAPDREASSSLLPQSLSENLTPRVAIVGLSLACSPSTPALAKFLSDLSISCGPPPEMGANNSFKPNPLRGSA